MKPFNMDLVSESLYVSNKVWLVRDLAILSQHEIKAIVNLVEDHIYDVPPPMVCLNCSFSDGAHVTPDQLREIYSFIDLHLQRTNVLAHCSAGVSRSVGIVIGQLMRENPDWTWEKALGVVNGKRAVWVSVETHESVLAYLSGRAAPPPPSKIRDCDAETLRQLQTVCGIRLREVHSIGWDTRGYVVEDGRVTGIGLYALDLAVIPKEIHRLTMMRDLYLCDNRLEDLPGGIAELGNLRTLNLSGNRLISLPDEIGELAHLHILNVACNQLKAIPDGGIQKLSALDRLYLHENCITSLPEGLGDLANITELYLQNNRLVRLPAYMSSLSRLRQFAVNGNEIRALPDSICNLPHLTTLNLSKNHMVVLPSDLGRLIELDNLNISSNRLRTLPKSIEALYKLRRLNIALNRFGDLPSGVERWLEELRDRGCIVIRENSWHS